MKRLVFGVALGLLAAGTPASEEAWVEWPPTPDGIGFAGVFAGASNGALIVAIREALWKELQDWRKDMRDPQMNAEIFEAHVSEQESAKDGAYRKAKGFRWPYLERWSKWVEGATPVREVR